MGDTDGDTDQGVAGPARLAGAPAPSGPEAGPGDGLAAGPIRTGPVPPLADGFTPRLESAPGLSAILRPGGAAVLVPARPPADGATDWDPDWDGACGKTQLAVHFAESLWRAGQLDLLAWVPA